MELTHTSLSEMVTVAGVSFPGLFFRLVQVLYFAVLGLMPCPLGIFWVLLGPCPLTTIFNYTAKGKTPGARFGHIIGEAMSDAATST